MYNLKDLQSIQVPYNTEIYMLCSMLPPNFKSSINRASLLSHVRVTNKMDKFHEWNDYAKAFDFFRANSALSDCISCFKINMLL